jgi:integrase
VDRTIGVSPFQRIALPRVDRERIVPLTVDQVRTLADAVGERYRAMVLVQAGCGLRLGELLALRAEDVSFLGRTVRVEDQIDRQTRERVPPKTARSRRTVPLPDVVSLALSAHISVHPPAANGLLFHTADGLPYLHGVYANSVFKRSAAKVGLPPTTSTHDLRHHFASVLLASGQSVVAVAELLGHENATLVLTTYGHLLPGGEELARKAIDSAWNAPVEQSPTAQGRPR